MGNIGTTELVIIAGVLILFFGSKRIPELFKGITASITEFKKGLAEEEDEEATKKK